ncbi:MAG: relaxase/mobilization nuclease domain-containing protein [Pirellulales bacterium]|nr:relaxase/mobilization nuclease domain-containing protein [Pirellulales bacterium]
MARKLPQAVLKISSHNTGTDRVRARLHYISRKGTLALETDQGVTLEGLEEIDALVDDWAVDFGTRVNSRDAMSLVISLPAGTDKEKATEAARAFFAGTFGENHEYVFAGHDDTENFHIHLVVKARGRDGKLMRPSRRDPQLWRQAFAEQARAHGIALDASPRFARGEGRRTPPTAIYELRRRGELVAMDQLAAKEAVRRAKNPRDRASRSESVIRKINARERVLFAQQALDVVKQAKSIRDDAKRLAALEIAGELASFAEGMPVPKSRMDRMKAEVKPGAGEPKVDDREARRIVKLVERGLRSQVPTFDGRGDQRSAIAVRARLTKVITERDRAKEKQRGR